MKKYEIIKNGLDDYTLKYKDTEINFKSTVEIVSKLQDVNKTARENLIFELAKKGMTVKELVKEQKIDGKTYYDNSNKDALEKIYIEQETAKIFQEQMEKMLGKSLTTLISEIGFTEHEEVEEFSKEIGAIMVGNFPSGK